jgi:hypothetical protein
MTPSAGPPLPAYGLTTNPFRLDTLDPLANPDDLGCVSLVDGWRDLRDEQRLIGRQTDNDGPVFFVVTGASKTGRTSVANYLIRLWADKRGLDKDSVVVHSYDPGDNQGKYDPGSQLHQWVQSLRIRNRRDPLGLSETTRDELKALTPSSTTFDFAEAIMDVEVDLRNPGNGGRARFLAAILERGKGKDLLRQVKESFGNMQALVIVTVDRSLDSQDVLDDIDKALPSDLGLVLELGSIQGGDVATIVKNRWNWACPDVDPPFDMDAVAEVFDAPRPIARVVELLALMLDMGNWRHIDDDPPWPASAHLGFDGDSMRQLLGAFDRTVLTGGK